MDITGIILAGGKSSRMGNEKGMQQLKGKPLIQYAIDVLSGICSNILISSSSEAYQSLGFRVEPDEFPGIGPMGGIYSALRKSATENNLVLSCDLPFVNHGLLKFILENSMGCQVAVPWEGTKHYEPLCGYYNKSVTIEMQNFIQTGNYKLPDLFDLLNVNKLFINNKLLFFNEYLFMNINSKRDLEAAETLMENTMI